jgi:HK97 family phage prohead protease
VKTIHRSESGRILRSGGTAAVGTHALRSVVASEGAKRDNHDLDPSGIIVPSSGRVPLVDSHNDRSGIASALGHVDDFRLSTIELSSGRRGTALLATLNFADPATNPNAAVAHALYRDGHCDAVSISFIPKKWTWARERGPGAMDISEAELLEISCVVVPSDPDARLLARALRRHYSGVETDADRKLLRVARARELQDRCRRDDELHGFSHLWPRR